MTALHSAYMFLKGHRILFAYLENLVLYTTFMSVTLFLTGQESPACVASSIDAKRFSLWRVWLVTFGDVDGVCQQFE